MAPLKEQAYEKLKEKVIDAEPGVLFTVRKCASELNLSYTPVREALLQLCSEGFLEILPNVGFSVLGMDMKKIQDISQSRECVEQFILPLVVKELGVDDLRILKAYVARQRKAMEEENIESYENVDVDFHRYLIDKLQNAQLSDFYATVRSQYSVGAKKIVQKHSEKPIEEHARFIKLVEEEKYEEAVECMKEHTAAAIERMKEGYVRIGL